MSTFLVTNTLLRQTVSGFEWRGMLAETLRLPQDYADLVVLIGSPVWDLVLL